MDTMDNLIEETNRINDELCSIVLEYNEIAEEVDKRRKLNIDT